MEKLKVLLMSTEMLQSKRVRELERKWRARALLNGNITGILIPKCFHRSTSFEDVVVHLIPKAGVIFRQ